MKLSLVIPTFNERENIEKLLIEIQEEFIASNIDGEIIIVDDNSPDGTGEFLEQLKNKFSNLVVIHRNGKLGLSSAVVEGWKAATGDVLGVMDADLSHPSQKISPMYQLVENGAADVVIGSRYVRGGEIRGWGLYRKILSKGATLLARIFVDVLDPMSGFFLMKKELLSGGGNASQINSRGFKILLEVLVKLQPQKIVEVPIVFTDRIKGKSKASLKEIAYYLKNLSGYLPYSKKIMVEFLTFAFIGFLGMLMNLAIVYELTERFGLHYMLSAIFAFIVASSVNFILNKIFTFRENIYYKVKEEYANFILVSICGLIVNLFFLHIFTETFGIYYIISQVMAIGISLLINFAGNKIWTFHNK